MINNAHLLEEYEYLLEKINNKSQCLILKPNKITFTNNDIRIINKILSEFLNIIEFKQPNNYKQYIDKLFESKNKINTNLFFHYIEISNEYFPLIIQESTNTINILNHLHAISKEMLIPLYIKNDNQIINNYLTSLIDNSMDQHIYAQYFTLPISLYVKHISQLFIQLPQMIDNNIYNHIKELIKPMANHIQSLEEILTTKNEDPVNIHYKTSENLLKHLDELSLNLYQLYQILMIFIFKTNIINTLKIVHEQLILNYMFNDIPELKPQEAMTHKLKLKFLNSLNNKANSLRNIHTSK